ncbi:MAG: hypothetical protein IKO01_00425 [Kiritimatiellae bacterium]|nr:hypothetical protein [Kiritimatiellia bacterium]
MTFKRFCLDTFYGPPLLWALSAGAVLAGLALYTFTVARILLLAVALLLLLCTVLGIVSFIRSLLAKAWLRATLQLVLGLILVILSLPCAMHALIVGIFIDFDRQPPESGWVVSDAVPGLPFTVEYKPAHPFLAEHYRRVVFPSGKHLDIRMNPGGHPYLSVYAFDAPGHLFCLSDGADPPIIVDAAAETVVCKNGAFGFPVASRRFLGAFGPGPIFIPPNHRAPDLLAEAPWQRADCPETLPFAIEYRPPRPYSVAAWRVVFSTGETVPLFISDGVSYGIYQLASGDYYLKGEDEKRFSYRYRIRPADRAMDLYGGPSSDDTESKPAWLEIPPDIVSIIDSSPNGIFCECKSSPEAIVTDVATPVGDTLDSLRRLGTITPRN